MSQKEVYFLFGCEVNSKGRSLMPWKTLPLVHEGRAVSRWEDVRYLLERRINLHAEGVRRGGGAFVSGMRRDKYKHTGGKWDARHRLRANDTVQPGEALVLFRRPLHRALSMYVPSTFGDKGDAADSAKPLITFDEDADEETKMQAVLAQSDAAHCIGATKKSKRPRGVHVHPCDLEYTAQDRPVPPESYVCRSCETSGDHFQSDCPRRAYAAPAPLLLSSLQPSVESEPVQAMPLDMVKMAHGIPKLFLKTVDNVHAVSMLTLSGEAVSDERVRLDSDASAISRLVRDAALGPSSMMFAKVHTDPNEDEEDMVFTCEQYLPVLDDQHKASMRALYKVAPHLRNKIPSICTHWINGLCIKGIACEYLHTYDPQSLPVCKFYVQGKCKNSECIFRHVTAADSAVRVCADYATGFCRQGARCSLQHVKRDAPHRADFGPDADAEFKTMVKAVDTFRAEELRQEAARKYKRPVCAIKNLASAQRGSKRTKKEEVVEEVFF